MKLYVNGDSHAAAAEAVNQFAFAEDDAQYFYLGRAPHPANAAVGWPRMLAHTLKAVLHNDSESASSNSRILRTTEQWIDSNHRWLPETVIVIGWSTWERQEWLIDGVYYQVNASGIDHVPDSHRDQYQRFITDIDWQLCTQQQHDMIWQLHTKLQQLNVRHIFFNGNNDFAQIPPAQRHDWADNYIAPYDQDQTYSMWLKNHGYHTVSSKSWHFGADSHAAWARFLLYYGIDKQIWS